MTEAPVILDQIYLPRRDAIDEEILVRQRQLATDYEWQFRIGITYSFGSIFNNVVNSGVSAIKCCYAETGICMTGRVALRRG